MLGSSVISRISSTSSRRSGSKTGSSSLDADFSYIIGSGMYSLFAASGGGIGAFLKGSYAFS